MIMNMVGGGGGLEEINGYTASFIVEGDNIKAGDFVQFNQASNIINNGTIRTEKYCYTRGMVKVSGNRIMQLTSINSQTYITIWRYNENNTLTHLSDTLLNGSNVQGYKHDLLDLGNNRFFISYTVSNVVYLALITVNDDNSITINQTNNFATKSNTEAPRMCFCGENKICVTYSISYMPYAVIVVINGDSYYTGTGVRIPVYDEDYSFYHCGCYQLSNNRVLLSNYRTTTSASIYMCVGTISGTSITMSTLTSNLGVDTRFSLISKQGDTLYFVMLDKYSSSSSNYSGSFYRLYLTVNSDNTITQNKGNIQVTTIPSHSNATNIYTVALLGGGYAAVSCYSTAYISFSYNDYMTYVSHSVGYGYYSGLVRMDDGAVVFLYSSSSSSNYNLSYSIIPKPTVSKATSLRLSEGIALTNGNVGNSIDVVFPNTHI